MIQEIPMSNNNLYEDLDSKNYATIENFNYKKAPENDLLELVNYFSDL